MPSAASVQMPALAPAVPRTPPEPNGTTDQDVRSVQSNPPTAKPAATIARAADTPETVIVHGSLICSETSGDGTRRIVVACLNAALATEPPPLQVPDIKARDAAGRGNPEALGTFSYTGTSIRMGANFGKSVTPERPAATVTANPIAGGK